MLLTIKYYILIKFCLAFIAVFRKKGMKTVHEEYSIMTDVMHSKMLKLLFLIVKLHWISEFYVTKLTLLQHGYFSIPSHRVCWKSGEIMTNYKLGNNNNNNKLITWLMESGGSMLHSQGSPIIPILSWINSVSRITRISLRSHLNLVRLRKGLYPVGLPVKILKSILPCSILATCFAYHNHIDLITQSI